MSPATVVLLPTSLYERDLALWAEEQAGLLREGRREDLDLAHLIDEVESVGHSQRDTIESRLTVLLAHLLKWRYQPGARCGSWRGTLLEQQRGIARVVRRSPSLKRYPQHVFADCYLSGRLLAAKETGIDFTLFPEAPPFTIDEVFDDAFLPREPDLEGAAP